ncbi:hypothetical protein [Acaryochloris thomasi]|uniref:hypothetical protein n=1 Tax=Acaryochloris thomasi TaxID=2929456 RepID=UPI000DA697AE|nr:hypothetical protein [Acaryochloris thomasi]
MSRANSAWALKWFSFFFAGTLAIYILRGFAVLSMLPGYVLWILLLLTLVSGLLTALQLLR